MLGSLEYPEQIVNKCQYFWMIYPPTPAPGKSGMQMRCKMMQITEFNLGPTLLLEISLQQGSQWKRGYISWASIACLPTLAPPWRGSTAVLEHLGWPFKWGASSPGWAVRRRRGSKCSPRSVRAVVVRYPGRGKCEGRCKSEEYVTH